MILQSEAPGLEKAVFHDGEDAAVPAYGMHKSHLSRCRRPFGRDHQRAEQVEGPVVVDERRRCRVAIPCAGCRAVDHLGQHRNSLTCRVGEVGERAAVLRRGQQDRDLAIARRGWRVPHAYIVEVEQSGSRVKGDARLTDAVEAPVLAVRGVLREDGIARILGPVLAVAGRRVSDRRGPDACAVLVEARVVEVVGVADLHDRRSLHPQRIPRIRARAGAKHRSRIDGPLGAVRGVRVVDVDDDATDFAGIPPGQPHPVFVVFLQHRRVVPHHVRDSIAHPDHRIALELGPRRELAACGGDDRRVLACGRRQRDGQRECDRTSGMAQNARRRYRVRRSARCPGLHCPPVRHHVAVPRPRRQRSVNTRARKRGLPTT